MKKIILSLMIIVGLFAITGCGSKEEKQNEQEKEEAKLILNDNLEFEVNSEVHLLSLISENNEVEILSENELIDSSKLGEKEVVIKYKDKKDAKEQIIKINIVDTKAPTIEYKKEITTTEGTKINLLKDVKVSDNSKEEIEATVEGKYDINKVGTYKLKYVASDSSNNKSEENFILKVDKKIEKYTKFGSSTLYYGKYKMEGDIPSEYSGTITINADGTATTKGHIYLNGNFVKKDMKGKWTVKAKSIGGLQGGPNGPDDIVKVDGIFFEWSDGSKSAFGVSNKYFGDQFHGYRWISE